MNKFNKFNLLAIGTFLLVLCAFLSYVGEKWLNLQGDYLSAAATLFAAVIAFLLFNDWKDQFLITKFEKYSEEIESLSKQLRGEMHEIGYLKNRNDEESNKILLAKYIKVRRILRFLNQTFLIYVYFLENFEKDNLEEYKKQIHELLTDIRFLVELLNEINRLESDEVKLQNLSHQNINRKLQNVDIQVFNLSIDSRTRIFNLLLKK